MGRALVTRRRSGRVALAVVLCGLALGGIAATSAAGSTWTGRQMPGSAGESMLFGISCPSASLCVAVGGNNSVASSTNPTGGAGSWNVAYAGEGSAGPGANYRQIRGVSCPSPQLCVAVSFEGLIFTSTDPTGPASAWTVADLTPTGPNINFYGVSCPSPTFCAAVAAKGVVVTSANPTGGAGAWTKTQLEGPLELRGVSCYSVALCVAVGDNGSSIRPQPGDEGRVVSSTNPIAGIWQPGQVPPRGALFGVSCPSPQLCLSGNAFGDLVFSTNPAVPGVWGATDAEATVQITDTDCPAANRCVAIDNNSDVLTSTNPSGGPGDWTFTNILPYPGVDETRLNGTFGVSCPSVSLCAIAAANGQIFTSTDPFVESKPANPTNGKKNKKQRHRKRPKRPRTKIARYPEPGMEISGRKVQVRLHFFARHHVQVRGFSCKLDGGPARRCRSPKTYTVGIGKHLIRVRAIGWTGLRGPAEVARFEVCHPTFPPQCQGKPIR